MSLSHWCYTLLIYKDTALTEELTKAHHDFFARKYKIDLWNSSQRQSTPRWRDKRIVEQNHSRWWYSHRLQNSRVRYCECYSPVKNYSCSEIKVDLEMCKNCLLKSRLISRLTWNEGKIHELPQKSRLFSKCARIPLLYLLFLLFFPQSKIPEKKRLARSVWDKRMNGVNNSILLKTSKISDTFCNENQIAKHSKF